MRVLQVINSLYTGGAEKLVVDMVPLMQERGMEVDVLLLKNERTPFWKNLEIKSKGKITGLSGTSVYNPFLIFKILPYLKKYDLVHVHLFPALYWTVMAKWLSFSKTKVIFTEHNTSNRRMNHGLFRKIDQKIYKGLTHVITISEKVDENIKKVLPNLPKSNFSLIPNGVNVAKFREAVPYSKDEFFSADDFILIQVSSFRSQKDQATLIRSLAHLPPKIKLVLVGDGPEKQQKIDLTKRLHLENRVRFLGLRSDIPQLLQMADVVVLSSFYEGLSLSSIEGMAVKPFIASDVPGLKEMVAGYGLLFEQGNEQDLTKQIVRLYQEKDFYNQIAQQCRRRAEAFTVRKMVKAYCKLYEEL